MSNSYNIAIDLAPTNALITTVDTVVDGNAVAIGALNDLSLAQVTGLAAVIEGDIAALNDLSNVDVQNVVGGALGAAIPGSPTEGSINERLVKLDEGKQFDSINYLISDAILHSNDDLVDSDEIAFAVKKKITCPITETIRIEFKIKTKGLAGQFAHGRIYKNGAGFGTDQATSTVNWETFSEDLVFSSSDLIELWCYGWPGPIGYQMKELRILGVIYQEFENTMV